MDATVDNTTAVERARAGAEMEYKTLRDEILRRIDSRQQVISITLTIAGAFLGIGWGTDGAVALLIYPLLALLLAAGWAQNEMRIRQLNSYIRNHLETIIPGLGYERYSREQDITSRLGAWPLDVLAIGGIFLLTQMMAVGLALFHFRGSLVEWIVLIASVISIALVAATLEMVRQSSSK
jgi:hypothetical protein